MVVESDRADLRRGLDKFQSKQEPMVVVDATIMDEKPRLVQFSFARLQGMGKNLTVFAVDKTEKQDSRGATGAEPENAGGRPIGERHCP